MVGPINPVRLIGGAGSAVLDALAAVLAGMWYRNSLDDDTRRQISRRRRRVGGRLAEC